MMFRKAMVFFIGCSLFFAGNSWAVNWRAPGAQRDAVCQGGCGGGCGPCSGGGGGGGGGSSYDNGAAAAAAAAAAEAQRQKDAELERQRIEAENQRQMEELANQARFIDDRNAAASSLRGSAGADSGLRGPGNNAPALRGSLDTSVVDLRDTSFEDANKALMRHQWTMSIDQRYKNDPAVQQYIRDLWKNAASEDDAKATENLKKIKSILADQLKVSGLTPQQVDGFFATFDTFTTGKGSAPKSWGNASKLAHEIDDATVNNAPQIPYYETLAKTVGNAKSIKADVSYMGTGPQTSEDCVLHAIANGAQTPFSQVKAQMEPTLKSLAIARSEVRKNPELATTSTEKGGTGGLNPFEEILIAKKVGNVIAVPDKNFAKAIESTNRPVITSVVIDVYDKKQDKIVNVGNHEVAVTGVHRAEDGKVYYSVMDSNLKDYANSTAYIEKADFENHMLFSGGFVIVPNSKN